jgi:hypothetical protein
LNDLRHSNNNKESWHAVAENNIASIPCWLALNAALQSTQAAGAGRHVQVDQCCCWQISVHMMLAKCCIEACTSEISVN